MICNTCNKKYKRKIFYEKHVLVCSILHMTKKEKEDYIEELDELPSYRKMYEIIKELIKKCDILEKKVQELQTIKRKKINIIAILNKFYFLSEDKYYCTINTLHTLIEINQTQIEQFIKQQQTFIECLKKIFDGFFNKYNNENNTNEKIQSNLLPLIKHIETKTSKLYVYYNQTLGWQEWNKKDFICFLDIIQKKILYELNEWKKRNKDKVLDDYWGTIYLQTMNKTLISFHNDKILKQIINQALHKCPILQT